MRSKGRKTKTTHLPSPTLDKSIGIVTVPAAFITFALQQTGSTSWLTVRTLSGIYGGGVLIFLTALTNDYHHLMWVDIKLPEVIGQYSGWLPKYGPMFLVMNAWAYIFLLGGTALLLRLVFRQDQSVFRRQALAILVSVLLPMVANIIYNAGFSPLPGVEMVPLAFSVSGITLSYGLFGLRFLDLIPVARDTVFESMSDSVVVLDALNRIVDLNAAAVSTIASGRQRRELLGKSIEIVLPERIKKRGARLMDPSVWNASEDIDFPLSDGTTRTFHIRITPLSDGSHEVNAGTVSRGRLVVLRDITALKKQEIDLIKARQAADQANLAKSAFLATMSHEIRTPLSGVIGMNHLLLETDLSPQQREFANVISTSSTALLKIINEILDFTKIEAGQLELEELDFTIRDCLEDAIDTVAAKAAEKDLYLALLVDPAVPGGIIGDEGRLRQILLNLINNAIKFTFHGTVVVRVSLVEDEHPPASPDSVSADGSSVSGQSACNLHFTVSDSGIGIPADKIDKLFRSFSQVEASHARRFGGSGLGLAISKRLAEAMGGRMWVESHEQVGSTFHFTVRAKTSDRTPSPTSPRTILAGKRVLIVDEVPSHREILKELVGNAGAISTAVSSLDSAQVSEAEEKWDVVVADGESAATRSEILDLGCPVLILSQFGKSTSNLSDASSDSGVTRMSKPVKQSKLERTLAALIDPSSVANSNLGATLEFLGQPKWDTHTSGSLASPINGNINGTLNPMAIDPIPDISDTQSQATNDTYVNALDVRTSSTDWHADTSLRILIVEDNSINVLLVTKLLARAGYTADVAYNGLEGLEAISKKVYDVVLCDIQMPIMDGFEATKRIRQEIPAHRQPTIIACTANALANEREACLSGGFDDYLSKPIDARQLAAKVRGCKRLPVEQI